MEPIFPHTNKYLLFVSQTFTELILGSALGAKDREGSKAQSLTSRDLRGARDGSAASQE